MKLKQLCFFFVAFMPVTKIFSMPSTLAKYSANDMILCYLISFIFDFLILQILLCTAKKQTGLPELLKNTVTNIPMRIIMFLYFLFYLIKGVFFSAEQWFYIELSLYQTQVRLLTFMPFLLFAVYLSLKKPRVLGRLAELTAAATLLSLIALTVISAFSGDYKTLLPIGYTPIKKIIKSVAVSLVWGGDSAYLLFLLKDFKWEKRARLKLSLSYLVGGAATLAMYIIYYAVFNTLSPEKNFALTQIADYSILITNSARFDFIAIFLLMFVSVIACSLPFYFSAFSLNACFSFPKKLISAVIPPLITCILFIVLKNKIDKLFDFIFTVFPYMALIFNYFIPALSPFMRRNKNDLQKN